jgi:hypothetical protein
MPLLSTMGQWLNRLLLAAKSHFGAVAQTVGFGPERTSDEMRFVKAES